MRAIERASSDPTATKPGNAGGAKGSNTPAEDADQPVRGGAGV